MRRAFLVSKVLSGVLLAATAARAGGAKDDIGTRPAGAAVVAEGALAGDAGGQTPPPKLADQPPRTPGRLGVSVQDLTAPVAVAVAAGARASTPCHERAPRHRRAPARDARRAAHRRRGRRVRVGFRGRSGARGGRPDADDACPSAAADRARDRFRGGRQRGHPAARRGRRRARHRDHRRARRRRGSRGVRRGPRPCCCGRPSCT